MKVRFEDTIIKLSTDDLPQTYDELIKKLPESFESITLPTMFSICYIDNENCPITVMGKTTFKSMREDLDKMKEKFLLQVLPKKSVPIIKVEEEANQLPIISSNLIHPIVYQAIVSSSNENPQNNRVPSQEKFENVGNDQRADESSIPNPNSANTVLNQATLDRNNENLRENREPKLEDARNDQIIHSTPIYTFQNVEFVVNEPDALEKGLSDRIEESQKVNGKNPKKGNKQNKGSKLKKELQLLQRDNKTHRDCLKDLEDGIEKKIKTSPSKSIGITHHQSQFHNKSFEEFRNKWEEDYYFEVDFEKGDLKVGALPKQGTSARLGFNEAITDENIKAMVDELLKALKFKEFDSLKISSLTFSFKNCLKLSKAGISYLFKIINDKFKNVRILTLDLYSQQSFFQHNSKVCELELNLQKLETLNLNFDNRWDLSQKEINMIIESLQKNSRTSLKSFNFAQNVLFDASSKSMKDLKSKLSFVENFELSDSPSASPVSWYKFVNGLSPVPKN